MERVNRFRHLECKPDSSGPTGRSDRGVEEVVEGAVRHVLDDDELATVRVGAEADEVHEAAGARDSGEDLDLILRRAGAVAAAGARGGGGGVVAGAC